MHRLDEKTLITPSLVQCIRNEGKVEGGDGRFAAFIQRSNGDFLSFDMGPAANTEAAIFARELLNALNRHLHHDGAWCIVFTHWRAPVIPAVHGEHTRFDIIWMDKDGDVHLHIDNDEGVVTAMMYGLDNWLHRCEAAWSTSEWVTDVIGAKGSQLVRRAAGEVPTSVH